jgi:hypothetical protein
LATQAQLETFIDHQKQEIKVKLTRANIITTKKID